MSLIRREVLTAAAGAAGALALPLVLERGAKAEGAPAGFVARDGTSLLRFGAPYRIAGANLWYAA